MEEKAIKYIKRMLSLMMDNYTREFELTEEELLSLCKQILEDREGGSNASNN